MLQQRHLAATPPYIRLLPKKRPGSDFLWKLWFILVLYDNSVESLDTVKSYFIIIIYIFDLWCDFKHTITLLQLLFKDKFSEP